MFDFIGSRKGQYFSFDAIIAAVIFVMTLILLLSYWNSVRTYLDFQTNDLNKEATRISNLLFMPPTFAQGKTDCADIQKFGLANSWTDKRINETLVKCLVLDEKKLREITGSSYNISIVITDEYTNKPQYTFGPDPAIFLSASTEISKIRRIGTLNTTTGDHVASVDLYVYR